MHRVLHPSMTISLGLISSPENCGIKGGIIFILLIYIARLAWRTVVSSLSLLWLPLAFGLLSGILWTQRNRHNLLKVGVTQQDRWCLLPTETSFISHHRYTFKHCWQGQHVICRDPLSSDASRLEVASAGLEEFDDSLPQPDSVPTGYSSFVSKTGPGLSQLACRWSLPTPDQVLCAFAHLLLYTLFHLLPHGLGLLPTPTFLEAPQGAPSSPKLLSVTLMTSLSSDISSHCAV